MVSHSRKCFPTLPISVRASAPVRPIRGSTIHFAHEFISEGAAIRAESRGYWRPAVSRYGVMMKMEVTEMEVMPYILITGATVE